MDNTLRPDRADANPPDLETLVAWRTRELQQALDRAQARYDQAPCDLLSLDADLRPVNLNRTLLDWLGYRQDEVIGHMDVFVLLSPAWHQGVQEQVTHLQRGEQTGPMEAELRRKDGSSFPVLLTSTAVRDEAGRFLHSDFSVVDLGQHDAGRRQSDRRHQLMVDSVQDTCIYFVDEHGTVSEWTASAQRLHGHHRAHIVGQPFRQLWAPNHPGSQDGADPDQLMRLAKAHGQCEARGWHLRDDGSRFWAHTVLTALRDEAGELQGLSSITRDMTAARAQEDAAGKLNKALEQRVAECSQQLAAAHQSLDVFSNRVSHDLRAPLRHIASFVSLLQEQIGDSSDPLVQQHLSSITRASKRMGLMIEGLLEHARLGRVAIQSQPVPLKPLVDGVIGHLQREHPGRSIAWVVEDDLPVVRGDAMLLAEVFTNLLDNAVKFTRPRETAHIEIGWTVDPVGGRTFHIRDDGVGFELEKAHNLFVMFQRQHHSMDFEGTGTGLALSQRIIERHGGRIWAETRPGEGCTFRFTLPFEGL